MSAARPGPSYSIGTSGTPSATRAILNSYGAVLREYAVHPEGKSLGPDGKPCTPRSAGVLMRRPVSATGVQYIGKEANKLEEGAGAR